LEHGEAVLLNFLLMRLLGRLRFDLGYDQNMAICHKEA